MNGASDGYRGNQYELSPQNEDLATEHKKTAQRLAEEHSISRASVERCARSGRPASVTPPLVPTARSAFPPRCPEPIP